MKLIIQIPCLNEAATLPAVLADLPRRVAGFNCVEILVVDDGSNDRTAQVALLNGADHVVVNARNLGLARSFCVGMDAALRLGADVVVNTDGDNQYRGQDVARLVRPIVEGRAEIVVGDRRTDAIGHFSGFKKSLQRIGSRVVASCSGLDLPDAVSGFRAFSRDAALRLNVVSPFSYTTETLIQAGRRKMTVVSVPVRTNEKTRESRLFKSVPDFVGRQAGTILRMYAMYAPLRVFFAAGAVLMTVGALPIVRFGLLFLSGRGEGHLQSLVLGGMLIVVGCMAWMFGLLADIVSRNRQLLEMTLERVRRMEMAQLEQAPTAGARSATSRDVLAETRARTG